MILIIKNEAINTIIVSILHILFSIDNKNITHPEESHRASAIKSSIRDVHLTGEIFGILYRRDHSFHRKESR